MTLQQNQPQQKYKNPVENLEKPGKGYSIAQDIEAQKAQFEQQISQDPEFAPKGPVNPEFKDVFTYLDHSENKEVPEKIQEIQATIAEIRATVEDIKRKSDGVNAEVEAIEKAAMQSIGKKPGVYHVRYLELLLSFLQGVKAKVGEAKTWLMAIQSKRAKRGSAFAVRSKKQGTQYSLSQELSTARNVQ